MKITTFIWVGALACSVGCQTTQEKKKAEQREYLQRLMLFERADISDDQVLSLAEFQRAYESAGRRSIESLFAKYDLNDNGVISRKEWLAIK